MKAAHIYLLLTSAFGLLLASIPSNPIYSQIALCVAISSFLSSLGTAYLNQGSTIPLVEVKSFCLAFFAALSFSLISCAVIFAVEVASMDAQWLALTIQGALGGVMGALIGHLWHERQELLHGTRRRSVDQARDRARG